MNLQEARNPTRRVIADRMVEAGAEDGSFVVFESDIGYSTYSYLFGDTYPERCFNMGIAELGTMAAAAGMAAEGRPAIVCGYGVFLTMRALEAVRSFVCYPQLNVKIFSSHGGLTAAIDGVTHQATEDVAFQALEAADSRQSAGIDAEVIDMYSIKPRDQDALRESLSRTGALLVAENHQRRNALGYELAAWCMREGIAVPFAQIGLDDAFGESGSYPLTLKKFGLDAGSITAAAGALVAEKKRRAS